MKEGEGDERDVGAGGGLGGEQTGSVFARNRNNRLGVRSHLVVVVEVADVALLGGGEDEARGEYGDLEESHGGMTRRAEGGEEVAKTAWDSVRVVEWAPSYIR
jgi:hypothetical protein